MVTDPIGDMLNCIKTAGKAGKQFAHVPYSDMNLRIANVLIEGGYITSAEKKIKKGKKTERFIEVGIAYDKPAEAGVPKQPRLQGAERVSRPSRRMYIGVADIKPFRQGHGLVLLSTPKGIMTDVTARKEHVGGEILCKIW